MFPLCLQLPANLVKDEDMLPPLDTRNNCKEGKFWTKEDLKQLQEPGFAIRDNFLGSDDVVNAIISELRSLKEEKMKKAGMKSGDEVWVDDSIRGDLHLWISDWDFSDGGEKAVLYPGLSKLMGKIEEVKSDLESCVEG